MGDSPVIRARGLSKSYLVPKKPNGAGPLARLWKSFFPDLEPFRALKGVDLEVGRGEFIGYIGPNGSGKSTTIKCLTGVLTPSDGEVEVLGFVPWRDRGEYTKHIGVIFGQKTLLFWDLAVIESMLLFRDVYSVPQKDFQSRLEEFTEVLELGPLLDRPVRKLSLGERMRCEIAASLLHSPRVLFLDEPTIGLDALAKESIRAFLRRYHEQEGLTILLTTHQMEDIETLCTRVVVLGNGEKIFDGALADLKARYVPTREIKVLFSEVLDPARLERTLALLDVRRRGSDAITAVLDTRKAATGEVVAELTASLRIVDLTISEPTLETVVKYIYSGEPAGRAGSCSSDPRNDEMARAPDEAASGKQ
ncbi:MAG: ATP-binding cassette domain-containing protein [Candidatus Wallbacteria bacterium]|nr:ATP-binding cassette domain-containing protein [Candidatus Wallbacteria bacterium]